METSRVASSWSFLMTALLSFGILNVESAAAVCVPAGNAAAILDAIAASADSNTPVTIKLEQGNYYFGQAPIGVYDAADMQILGGYVPTNGHTCDENQRTVDAGKTTLQLDGNYLPLRSPSGSITLEGLTLGGANCGRWPKFV